jgi:sulfate permease, SulP family
MTDRSSIAANLSAGFTVAIVAVPLNLALAVACGLPPGVGLVTGAIAGLIGAFLGASRFQITGPEVALVPITLEIATRYGHEGLVAATLMAGVLQILAGVLRVGRLIHVIPVPVLGGFLAAVGLLVFDSQLPRFLGMPGEVTLLSRVEGIASWRSVNAISVALGALVVATLVLIPRVHRRIPAPLVAVAVAVAAVVGLGPIVPTVSAIEVSVLTPTLPSFGSLDLVDLIPEAVALALLASIDSLLCAVSVDARTGGERTRADQELSAQGVANLVCACFGGMPVASAVVRSVTAVEAGATTRLTPVTQSVLLGLVLFVLAPFVRHVPLVALASILLVIGFRLIDFRMLRLMWRASRFEAAVFLATAAGILATDFVIGVGIGVGMSLVHFAREQRLALAAMGETGRDASIERASLPPLFELEDGVRVVHLGGPLFFGSQDVIDKVVGEIGHEHDVILDVCGVTTVDISGARALESAIERLCERGVRVKLRFGRGRAARFLARTLRAHSFGREADAASSAKRDAHSARAHLKTLHPRGEEP